MLLTNQQDYRKPTSSLPLHHLPSLTPAHLLTLPSSPPLPHPKPHPQLTPPAPDLWLLRPALRLQPPLPLPHCRLRSRNLHAQRLQQHPIPRSQILQLPLHQQHHLQRLSHLRHRLRNRLRARHRGWKGRHEYRKLPALRARMSEDRAGGVGVWEFGESEVCLCGEGVFGECGVL